MITTAMRLPNKFRPSQFRKCTRTYDNYLHNVKHQALGQESFTYAFRGNFDSVFFLYDFRIHDL